LTNVDKPLSCFCYSTEE